jgi:prevent-host-death family protein
MSRLSPELARNRDLSRHGVPTVGRISSTDLRRELREVLARVEFAGQRFEILRQGKPVAAVLPLDHLRRLEEYERTGIRHAREHLDLLAELHRLRAASGG